jgi:hypothetical protein
MQTSNFERIRGWLQYAMKEHGAGFDDVAVNGVITEMRRAWRPEYAQLGLSGPDRATAPAPAEPTLPRDVEYAIVESTHARVSGPGQHSFVGVVPMVCLDLPKTQEHILADTKLGLVVDGDIKLYCLDVANGYYRERFGFDAERISLLTPLRVDGGRFAPILVGLAYRKASDERPSAFYLAGGMANGPTRVLYSSPNMQPIRSKGGYVPTPFSDVDNGYYGGVELDLQGRVGKIWIDITAPGAAAPHFTIRAEVKSISEHDAYAANPYTLLLQAALRVCAIAQAMGQEVPDLGPLTGVLAPLGRANYPWIKPPT